MTNEKSPLFPPQKPSWPAVGDQLFQPDEDWWNNSWLNYDDIRWEYYITGYKTAGNVLVNHIKVTHSDRDFLIFPIVFVYRQYLELRLKSLIWDCKLLFDEPAEFPKVHDLKILWSECKGLIERLDTPPPMGSIEGVDESIIQFSELDPGSFSFRYPTNKDGDKSVTSNLRSINVRNLSDGMEKLSNFFDTAAEITSTYLDHKQRYVNDLRDWG